MQLWDWTQGIMHARKALFPYTIPAANEMIYIFKSIFENLF
jgi:hypothetical protein